MRLALVLGLACVMAAACGGKIAPSPPESDAPQEGLPQSGPQGAPHPAAPSAADASSHGLTIGTVCPAAEGAACPTEDAYCTPTPCIDACKTCDAFQCLGGRWQRLDQFGWYPLPRYECADVFPCDGVECPHGSYCLATVEDAHAGTAPARPTFQCLPMDPQCLGGCQCGVSAARARVKCASLGCTAPDGGPLVECHQD